MAVYGMKLFAGNSNPALSERICEILEIPLGKMMAGRFSDGEIRVEIDENVRGADVFLIQSGASPVNDNLMELLVMIDACKRASARRITAVMPYYCYGRQDRKNKPRVPITAWLRPCASSSVPRNWSVSCCFTPVEQPASVVAESVARKRVRFIRRLRRARAAGTSR